MQDNVTRNNSYNLVLSSLMVCLILLGTIIFRIPVPLTQGYVHLGDAMIYLSVLLLGKKQGALAAGLGSALGDILGGFAFWAPWSFIIKFAMAYVTGAILASQSTGFRAKQNTGASSAAASDRPIGRTSDRASNRTIGRMSDRASNRTIDRRIPASLILAMTVGGVVMCAGYLLAERVMYGSWSLAAIGLPWNAGQFVIGTLIAIALRRVTEYSNS